MKRVEATLISIWEDIYFIFKDCNYKSFDKHSYFMVLDDLIIETAIYDNDEFLTKKINTKYKKYIDKYMFIIAEVTTPEIFRDTFTAIFYAINNLIREKELKEQFEAASNFTEIKNIFMEQKFKWII